jgi:hypothetical protein
MALIVSGNNVVIDDLSIQTKWLVLQAVEGSHAIYVLIDPDTYLADPQYKAERRAGAPAFCNLLAYSRAGELLWQAELPESSDYYYFLSSAEPLLANSFSSYRCELDAKTGAIVKKVFFK